MTILIKYACGVDMASKKFDVCLTSLDIELNTKIKGTKKFDNTASGIKAFYEWLQKKCKSTGTPVYILVEATGVYHEELAYSLSAKGANISVVLPNKAQKHLQSLGLKSKNDKIDAYGLSLMCAQQKHEEFKPLDPFYYELKTITRFYQTTQENITAYKNQLHALEYGVYSSNKIKSEMKKLISANEKLKDCLVKEMKKLVNDRPDIKKKIENILGVKGIGFITVCTIVAETAEFENFKNIPGLVSSAGFDVVENTLGKHVGKTKISKRGNSRIRRALHLPSFVVVKYEKRFKVFYDRIFERSLKPLKAYVAVQKKMLVLIYTLWKNNQEYNSNIYFQNLEKKVAQN
ncbi:IS110 family transposase [Aureivirga sp. CE67]|uniref:IS110 family transposase n=1 Tax=Aureivirga sp. CE67 TaxID=1788983 RepID=UPI0018CA2DFD|nr:IS110 family transposase [Aureivirga sp. CE67]